MAALTTVGPPTPGAAAAVWMAGRKDACPASGKGLAGLSERCLVKVFVLEERHREPPAQQLVHNMVCRGIRHVPVEGFRFHEENQEDHNDTA